MRLANLRLAFGALACSLLLNGCAIHTKPPVVPPPPPAPVFCVAPIVRDAVTLQPIANANEFVSTLNGRSDVNGYHYFFPVPMPNVLNIFADGYQDYSEKIDIESLSCNHPVLLQPKKGPRPTDAQTANIKANFLSIHDSQNRLMFSWFYTTLGQADRALWRQAYAAASLTHAVLDFNVCYPGYWAPCGDFRGSPSVVVSAATELLDNSIIPIVMMTTGDDQTWNEIDQFFPGEIRAMRVAEPCMLGEAPGGQHCAYLSIGFEVGGPCSTWSSANIARALTSLHNLAPNAWIAYEPCPERFTGSSNPVQPDDPWQGNEAAFYTSNGGQFINAFLYETPHGDKLLNPSGASGQFCHLGSPCGSWEDRWFEGLQRVCTGGLGWRLVPCSFFEVTGSDYKGGGVTDATVVRLNNRALALANATGAVITFGNGLPTGPQ
jgi:hypothetical protein